MNNYFNNHPQSPSRDLGVFQSAVDTMLASDFNSQAPPAAMSRTLGRTGEVERFCDKRIRKAREEGDGKLTVKKRGAVIDDNGHRVEAFAFELGRLDVEGTLYAVFVVDMLYTSVYVLLVRSDTPADFHRLFPNIGTAQDWKTLRKCIDRFSPKTASYRFTVDWQKSRHAAAEIAATTYLEHSGVFNQGDLASLQDMDAAKLHMIDLCAVIALMRTFPSDLTPRMIHVLCTQDADDLDEIHRIFKAMDFTLEQSPGLYVPAVLVRSKKDLESWRKSLRFSYMTYDRAQGLDCLFVSMSQALTLHDNHFIEQFPYAPVVVGPNIWSNRNCVEIDMRGLRFSNEELLVGRKYIASLLKHHILLMSKFVETWQQSITSYTAAVTPYPQLWFQSFHFAAGMTLFPASNALMDYINLTQEADTHRLRLRTDRAKRYADAIQKLKEATETEPWLYGSKPQTKAEALALLEKNYDAFLHQKDGRPVLAFTEASLIRCANLEQSEVTDFVLKLKEKHLLSNKTHPVTFSKREQFRFICINAEAISVTAVDGKGEMI